jgi:hypothetical protein
MFGIQKNVFIFAAETFVLCIYNLALALSTLIKKLAIKNTKGALS